ncbi:molybdenum cofactor biosynthesis protein MoaE [Crenothrix sp.]|uniref:molybdenum cofactor biosynthesis protein MoaE n=1 Tax=Crenothrix sp. TaxID=3100433 RepID=UPI00374D2CC7
MTIKICSNGFDPWQEIQSYQNTLSNGCFGATNIFIGTMRDFNAGEDITCMTLEHYPGMTEKQLENIVLQAKQQWQVIDALVVHRVGEILPNEPIVLIAIWTAHRGDAFDACRYVIEALKSSAPFWKKEVLTSSQAHWVTKNTDGYQGS